MPGSRLEHHSETLECRGCIVMFEGDIPPLSSRVRIDEMAHGRKKDSGGEKARSSPRDSLPSIRNRLRHGLTRAYSPV